MYPPLPSQLILKSLTADKNDHTGELGYWLDNQDMKRTAKFAADIEVLRKASQAK